MEGAVPRRRAQDRPVVRGRRDAGPEQAALAQAIVKLANALGIETVAEGVEADAQAEVLASWGCTNGQGWLWAPAPPVAAAVAFLPRRVTAPTS